MCGVFWTGFGRRYDCQLSYGGRFYPDFYLMVKTSEKDHIYVCRKANTFATSVYCTGQALPIGQMFQFLIISLDEYSSRTGSFPSLVWLVTRRFCIADTRSYS
jgi:hypothetical protein